MGTICARRVAGLFTLVLGLHAQQYRIDTFAGGTNVADNGPAVSALLLQAQGIAFDTEHRLYIADAGDNRVRRVENDGTIVTFAGTGLAGFSGDNGPAKDAQLRAPYGLAIDVHDNVYIADLGNSRVRKVTADGTIATIAGGGLTTPGGDNDGGLATDYVLGSPRDLAVGVDGTVFLSDFSHHQVYQVDSGSTLITLAGTGQAGQGSDFGAAFLTPLIAPAGLALLNNGSLLVCDSGNHMVRRIVGSRIQPFVAHSASGLPIHFSVPTGIAVKPDGSILIADQAAGVVYQIDKSGQAVPLHAPAGGIAADDRGNVFVSSQGLVSQLKQDGSLVLVAGSTNTHFLGEAVDATAARLDHPSAVTMDGAGNTYIADTGNNRIRKVDSHGTITTFAGNGSAGYSGDGGLAIDAQLNHPSALALDANGNLLVADTGNNVIRKVTADGAISTVAGTGNPGVATDAQPAIAAPLNAPAGIVISGHSVFIADTGNHSVRVIDAEGNIRRVAGMDASGSDGDNGPALSAHLQMPRGLAFDGKGNLFIADQAAGNVRRVDADGNIASITNPSNGPWVAPTGVIVTPNGSVLVIDAGTNELRNVLPDSSSVLLAGTGSAGYSGDQGPAVAAQLSSPTGLFASTNGSIHIADTGNGRVRILTTDAASVPVNVPEVQVVNGGSRLGGPVAPGEIVSILGPQLGVGEDQYANNSSVLPTLLGETQVLVNGRPAPILFVRSGEVQIQIPYELSDSNSAQLEVLSRGEPVGTASLTVASTAPGIYSLDGTGASTALVLEENGFLNSQGNPAASGWLMTLFLTGEGLTSGTNKTGVAAEAGSTPRIPVSVFLNGQQLQTIAVEELTGMPGVSAVTFVLPGQLSTGAGSLRIAAGAAVSQPNLTIWTQGAP
jgi:trimeric autotransporter adhesin